MRSDALILASGVLQVAVVVGMNHEPDCLAGLVILLLFGMLSTIIVIMCNPTAEQRQIWLNASGRDSTGMVWTGLLQ